MRLVGMWKSGVVVATAGVVLIGAGVIAFAQRSDRSGDRRVVTSFFGGSRIGVTVADIEPTQAERQSVQGGATIEEVMPNSPAEKAGLMRSDVVVEYDGERVRSARQFSRLVEETPAGRTVRLSVMRDGRKTDVQVTPSADQVGNFYVDGPRIRAQVEQFTRDLPKLDVDGFRPRARLGVVVDELTPQLAGYFGAKEGVLVTTVTAASSAERAGLKAGDVITSVNNVPIRTRADFLRQLREVRENEATLGVVRDKKATTLKATMEQPAARVYRSGRPA